MRDIDRNTICFARWRSAQRGAGRVSPNPMVGCVIVKDGRIIGEGWHEHIGGLHAERNALRTTAREDAAGARTFM